MRLIQRHSYFEQLKNLRGASEIKIISGIRRSGKSTLLLGWANYLRTDNPKINLIFINLQDLDYEELKDYKQLHQYCVNRYHEGVENVLMIDEVQMCPQFELAINSLHDRGIFDIYLTGSNAFLLSSDLATLFTGRTMQINVFPFSFSEYAEYKGTDNIQDLFEEYVRFGGLPGMLGFGTDSLKYEYIRNVYNTIMFRDIVQKYKIRNRQEFESLLQYLMDNISNLTSVSSVTNCFRSGGNTAGRETVTNYIECMLRSYVFFQATRYDVRGKQYLSNSYKYYLSDHGMRYAVLGTRNLDIGRVYENIVYIELLRRRYDVYIGKLYQKEIDFVATRGDEKLYIQVPSDVSAGDTMKRELDPLLAIRDAYPKMILSRTRSPVYDREGVQIVDLALWLS